MIVEPRCHKALSFVLNNILTNLSNDWNVIVFHGSKNEEYVEQIIQTDLSQYAKRITLHNLGVENMTVNDYNKLLATKSFYDYIPTEMFLVFQTDSMIIPKYAFFINAFLNYDYVGAPWKDNTVGNGGFSLRRKSKMLEVIERVPYHYGLNEDVYFSKSLQDIYKPSVEEAKRFSVETVFSDMVFACHKPWCYEEGIEFMKAFPETYALSSLQ